MAEPQTPPAEGQDRRPSPGGGPNGGEKEPETIEELRAALETERRKASQMANDRARETKARQELSNKIKAWNSLEEKGYTPEQVDEILGKQQKQELEQARDKGEIDKLLENQRKTLEKQRTQIEQQLEAERSLNNEVLLDSVLMQELGKVCDPDLLEGAFALHRGKAVMVEDPESKYKRKGMMLVGGEHMEIADFVKNWAETNERAQKYLKPSLASGGGAAGGTKFRKSLYKSEMTAKEISDYINAHGKIAFDNLPRKRETANP